MDTILLATDGSDAAADALAVAIELCHDTGAKLEVLTVTVPQPATMMGPHVPIGLEDGDETTRVAVDAAAKAQEAGITATPRTRRGDPTHAIADAAKELGADLVVVGSRGLGPIRSTLLGSVSRGLTRHATTPILVVRPGSVVHATAGAGTEA